MEKSDRIEIIADEISDKIISRMRYVEKHMLNSFVARNEIDRLESKIQEFFSRMSSSVEKIRSNNSYLSSDELNRKIKQTEENYTKEILDLIHKKDQYIQNIEQSKFTKLQQIRFVYLALGDYLEKNTDFFLNDKLDELALSDEEMNAVYSNNLLLISDNNKRKKVYQIICRSAAIFLKTAFDKLGIESAYIHTISSTNNNVKHWFIVAQDDLEKQYFLTLAADLPFIKNNFPTEHFATEISLFDEQGNLLYDVDDISNKNIKLNDVTHKSRITGDVFSGVEVSHTILSNEELKELDYSINYSQLYEALPLLSPKNIEKTYSDILCENSTVSKMYRKCFGFSVVDVSADLSSDNQSNLYKSFDDLKIRDYCRFKSMIEEYVYDYICKKHKGLLPKNCDFEFFIKDCLTNLLDKSNIENVDLSLSSDELLKKYKKQFNFIEKGEYRDVLKIVRSLLFIENSFESFFSLRDRLDLLKQRYSSDLSEEELCKLRELLIHTGNDYKEAKKRLSISVMRKHLNEISYVTSVKNKITFSPTDFVPQASLVERFQLMVPRVLDCNYGDYSTVKSNDFSTQNYSEQIVIVKRMLALIFSDLRVVNCSAIQDYDMKYSAVDNRINTYPLKDRKTGEFCIGFTFTASPEEGTVEFIYIPSKNLLRRRNPITDRDKYWIVSKRYNKELQEIENIEKNKMVTEHFADANTDTPSLSGRKK